MVGALIKIFFKSLFVAIFIWVFGVLLLGGSFFGIWESDNEVNWNVLYAIGIICFIILLMGNYVKDKEKTTCPRCKESFVYIEEKEGTETLSEDYISQDVKDSEGIYRRKSYRIGKEKHYYRSTCKECGYTDTRTEVGSFKREV